MRRFAFALALAIFSLSGRSSLATVTMHISVTGDNYIYFFAEDRAKWQGVSNGTWKKAYSFDLPLDEDNGTLYFAVRNKGLASPGNGAGFLGEFRIDEGVFSSVHRSYLLTGDPGIYIAKLPGWLNWSSGAPDIDLSDLSLLDWAEPVSWGMNGQANFWFKANGGPVEGISASAHWLWFSENFNPLAPDVGVFKVEFSIERDPKSPSGLVPEPTPLFSLSLGLVLLGTPRRRWVEY